MGNWSVARSTSSMKKAPSMGQSGSVFARQPINHLDRLQTERITFPARSQPGGRLPARRIAANIAKLPMLLRRKDDGA